MSMWWARVEYESPDPVHAPTALAMAVRGLTVRRTGSQRLELGFPVEATTLRAATETAVRLARRAMKAADMDGTARAAHLEPAATDLAAVA